MGTLSLYYIYEHCLWSKIVFLKQNSYCVKSGGDIFGTRWLEVVYDSLACIMKKMIVMVQSETKARPNRIRAEWWEIIWWSYD